MIRSKKLAASQVHRRSGIILGCTTGVEWRLNLAVIDINQFKNFRLQGGFIITDIELTDDPIVDAIGREAIAQTQTIAGRFRLFIRSGLSEEELSITLYHEILKPLPSPLPTRRPA